MMQVCSTSRRSGAAADGVAGGAVPVRLPGAAKVGRNGFTLLEVLIALTLMIMLMGGVYGFYVNTMKARDTAIRSMRDTLLMRALLEQMAEEIRQITDVVPDKIGFNGDEEELTFVRLRMPDMGAAYAEVDPMSEDPKPGQQDLMRITYKLQWDEEEENLDEDGTPVCYGLLRSQQTPIDPNPSFVLSAEEMAKYEEESGFKLEEKEDEPPPVAAELIAPEVKYLRFEYFDGAEWRDRWQVASQGEEEAAAGAEGGEAGPGLDDGGEGDAGGDNSGGDNAGGEDAGGDGSGRGGRGGDEGQGGGDGFGRGNNLGGNPLGDAGLGGSGGGMGGGGGQEGYVLPQAIRITVGKVKVPRREDDFDVSRAAEEDELDKRTYHPDRWTVTIYLRQADQSQLSSRKYGIDNDISGEGTQTGEQTEGGGR